MQDWGREAVRSLESYCKESCSFPDSFTLAAQVASTPLMELQLVDRAAYTGGVNRASSEAPSNRAIGSKQSFLPCRLQILHLMVLGNIRSSLEAGIKSLFRSPRPHCLLSLLIQSTLISHA